MIHSLIPDRYLIGCRLAQIYINLDCSPMSVSHRSDHSDAMGDIVAPTMGAYLKGVLTVHT